MKFLIPKALRSSVLYVRIRAQRLHVRDTRNGKEYIGDPVVALPSSNEPGKVLSQSFPASVEQPFEQYLVNGFDHPRTIIQDFSTAHIALKRAAAATYYSGRFFRFPPVVVMHPLEKLEGGLTPVERTALLELAKLIGARQAFVWIGRELGDHELQMDNVLKLFWGR